MTSSNSYSEVDEETWKLLASSRRTEDLGDRLTGLAIRLEEDGGAPEYWDNLMNELQNKGFQYSTSSSGKLVLSSAARGNTPNSTVFESEAGKHHIQAVAALLQISNDRAMQVTMDAMRSIDSEGSNFQALLGSRDLLWKTLLHQQKQRLARLGVVAESLRLEQDPDASNAREIKVFLDSLDDVYHDEDRHRGLFRRLLTIACAPTVVTTRDQLDPARSLRAASHTNTPPEREWNSFCGSIAEEFRMQQMRERKEALEALLVLLYDRMSGGVRRADYAALLIAFASQDFYGSAPGPKELVPRLTHLTGLICAECMALWRTLDASSDWTAGHPFFVGMSVSGNPQLPKDELEKIRDLLLDFVQKALGRNNGVGNPESLGMLAFGLLIQLGNQALKTSNSTGGDQAAFSTFNESALEMVQIANDRCGAFDYLYAILDELVGAASGEQPSAAHDFLYDWQLSDKRHGMLLEDSAGSQSTASEAMAYTSIAREVLAASITAYGDSVLAIDQANSLENIGMLCCVGNMIFQGNPLLCQQFWADWEVYSNDSSTIYPICMLLDAAYQMATTALQVFDENRISQGVFVQAAAPFLQLLSSLSHKSEMVESAMATFPSGLLRRALLCCRLPLSTNGDPSQEFRKSRSYLLSATARLAQIGNSESCLVQLRASLEETSNNPDGPKVLSRLITGEENDAEILDPVLTIMAHLLDGAPQQWAMLLAREIMDPADSQGVSLTRCFANGKTTVHAASLVLAELIEHLTAVVFSDAVNNNDTIAFLHCLESSILAGAGALAGSLPTSSSVSSLSFGTVQNILQSLSNFLKVVRTVIQLHSSPEVRATGSRVRDSIIETLGTSTSIGQAIIYYATAPISLTLAIKLEGAVEDKSMLLHVSGDEYDPGDARKYGAWHSYLSHSNGGKYVPHTENRFLIETATKLTSDDIDLDGASARGWTGRQQWRTPLDAAFSSIRLLSQWASHVDDIVSTHVDDLCSEPRPLEGKAKEIVEAFSPFRLLSSLASVPIPCRDSSSMVSVWDSAGLTNLELLLPYLSGTTQNGRHLGSIPSSTLLDLLNSSIAHIGCVAPRNMVADTIFFRALYRSSRFSIAIASLVERAMDIGARQAKDDSEEKVVLLDGLLGLRVLASCVSSNPTIAHASLYPEGSSIIAKLVSHASTVKAFLLSSSGTLFSKDIDITKMRLATGALAVLSSLWQSIRTGGHPTETDASKLCSALDEYGSFITELILIVSSYTQSKDLEDRLEASNAADYAHGTLVTYIALSLQILAREAAHQSFGESAVNSALMDFLLRDFLRSGRLVDFTGYRRLSGICMDLKTLGYADNFHPLGVLACFPSTSSACFADDFYTIGNSFDVSASLHFLEQHASIDGNFDDTILKLSTSHQLANANLLAMEAWKRFSETSILFSSQLDYGASSTERHFELIDDTITAFEANLVIVNDVQDENTGILRSVSRRMASLLGELLLFFLNLGTRYSASVRNIPLDFRILVLEKLAAIGTLALSVTSSTRMSEEVEYPSLTLGTTVLACAIVALDFVDPSEFTPADMSRLYDVCKTLCRTSCKVLPIARQSLVVDSQNKDSHRSFMCCISLLTLIISRKQGASVDAALYRKAASSIMAEFNTVGEVLGQGISCATAASKEISSDDADSRHASMHLATLQGILDLLLTIAEKGRPDILNLQPEPKMAQLLVRNPLFRVRSAGEDFSIPRGYRASTLTLPSPSSTFKVGEDDAVHAIWRSSMRVMTAAVASSHSDDGRMFSEMIYEFVEVYRHELVFALDSCGSRLTLNGLKEATDILGMIGEMCRRDDRNHFHPRLGALGLVYIAKAGFVLAVLSKFLGASGTARELFDGIERYISDSENFELGRKPVVQPWHPLMAEGIPSAKHEAVKFAHYASKCLQAVSTRDFRESSQTSDLFKSTLKGGGSENDLERSSRMAVTNTFAVRMEKQVAACIGEALSILWRMHPASFSFRSLSEFETTKVDLMSLAPIGSIIGFRPFEGNEFASFDSLSVTSTLSFGRVVSIDTVKRTWDVSSVDTSNDNVRNGAIQVHTWTVRAGQLSCFEDTSFRKSITAYCPAPDSMSDLECIGSKLTLGNLILIQRWCHQESLFSPNGESSTATRRLAEQACALLGAELSIQNENGERLGASSKEQSRVDAQIFELLADIDDIVDSGQRHLISTASFQHGRLKAVISSSTWQAIRPQVVDEVRRCWKERQDKERHGKDKRSFGGCSSLLYRGAYSSGRGSSPKSAFRGSR